MQLIIQSFLRQYIFIQVDLILQNISVISIDKKMEIKQDFYGIISQLSSNDGYFYVRHRALQQEHYSKQRTLLVYSKKHTKTIQELMEIYADEVEKKDLIDILYFELEKEYKLHLEATLQQLKMKLRRDNLDGVSLFAYEDNRSSVDESSSTQYIESDIQYNENAIDVTFVLPNVDRCIYLPIKAGNKSMKQIKQQLKTEILRVFSVDMDQKNINLSITDQVTNKKKKAQVKEIENIYDSKTQIFVDFSNNFILKKPPMQNNHFIVIKDTSKADFKSKTLPYDEIKHQKVIDILRKVQKRDNWEQYGLKIEDIAMRPNDIVEHYIKNLFKNTTKHSKHIAALIVLQEHIFQLQTQKIASKNELIDLKTVAAEQTSIEYISVIDDMIKQNNCSNSKTGKKVKFSAIKYYTAGFRVASSDKKTQELYKIINTHMRSIQFCKVTPDEYQKWEYNYISHLYHELRQLESRYTEKKPLWRGLPVICKHKKDQIVVFKGFTSTSTEKQKACGFGAKTLYKIVKSHFGRPISQFSDHQEEKQVLFMAYTKFRVIGFEEDANKFIKNVVILQEIPRIQMPEIQLLKIFWIDDKTWTAKMYWQNFENVDKSIVMIQLLNNQQFQTWFQSNKQIAEDKSVEMVMISNMNRKQNGVQNYKAGVKSAQIFRKHRPDSKIFYFIGNKNQARANLLQKNLQESENLLISDDQVELYSFLFSIAGLN